MSQISNIEWTEATWNFLAGCDKVSPGCKNCYAIKDAWRMAHNPNPKMSRKFLPVVEKKNGNINWTGKITFTEDALMMPLRIKKPTKFFVNSLSDLFHKDVKDEWIDKAFAVMALCPQHIFQMLTKRPERMVEYLSHETVADRWQDAAVELANSPCACLGIDELEGDPLPNVWLGVSVEDQKTADERIPLLLQAPAAVRWLSMEPLLGRISLRWLAAWTRVDGSLTALRSDSDRGYEGADRNTDHLDGLRELDWIVAGGESGPKSRPVHPDWIRTIRNECSEAEVPFFFKQWGSWLPIDQPYPENFKGPSLVIRSDGEVFGRKEPQEIIPGQSTAIEVLKLGKKKSGRLLDGRVHNEFPVII